MVSDMVLVHVYGASKWCQYIGMSAYGVQESPSNKDTPSAKQIWPLTYGNHA